ncbi:MAG: MATE family efflux transporter, partial [Candidatus Enteromonas sp.]|nr:MATE family efflux transporter [Candidatus Enteromonas sp.]
MTKGSIYKAILVFLVPTILSMVFQQIYTLTDAIIVGQTLSESEVAGVNSTGSLVFIVLNFGIGCTSGFSVVIAAAIGANDSKRMRRSYLIQIILCFLVSVALTFIGIAMIPTMLGFLGIHESAIDPAMHAEYLAAATYLTIIFAGTIAQVFYNMIVSILRAMGDSFNPFLFLVASTI